MIIETEGLTKQFGRKRALNGLSFNVPKGAAMAMIGANGAGKTTALRTLVNLHRPTRGTAKVMGVDSRRLGHRDFQNIGYVSENLKLPSRLSVEQYFAYLRPMYERWDGHLEANLRAAFDLPPSQRIGALSHGMRLKVAIASVLPFHPQLLILDEPLGGLDPLVRDEVLEGLLDLAGECTILISSHELSEIEGFATDVAFIEDGALKFQEPMESLRSRFRAVTASFKAPLQPPANPPPPWLSLKASGHSLTFVDTGFEGEAALAASLTAYAGTAERIDAQPLSLRDISKALMRAARTEARP